jgi:hypothetical protein
MTERFSFDSHLREEDSDIFHHAPRSWRQKHLRARDDIIRDLKRRGYLDYDDFETYGDGVYFWGEDEGTIIDDSEQATVELEFTATADGPMTVPAGTRVYDVDPAVEAEKAGAVVFETDSELQVSAGSSATVQATAEHPGEPYNVRAKSLQFVDEGLTNFDAATNPQSATGGKDHQLTRMSVYRVMELVFTDLLQGQDDAFAYRMELYGDRYDEELDRMTASGIKIDLDGDGEQSEGEEAFEHAGVRLRRG